MTQPLSVDETSPATLSREDELRILFTDTDKIPESIMFTPKLTDLGILAKFLMDEGVIDHTFFTANW